MRGETDLKKNHGISNYSCDEDRDDATRVVQSRSTLGGREERLPGRGDISAKIRKN